MPAKSKSQWAKLAILRRKGKLSKAKFDEFTHGVDWHKLPQHVKSRKAQRRAAKTKKKKRRK